MPKKSSKPKTKSKPVSKKKGSKKMAKSTGRTVVSMLRPRKIDAIMQICKQFLDGQTPNLNTGLYTKQEMDVLEKARGAAAKGKKPHLPFLYSPAIVQIARKQKSTFVIHGQVEKQPKEPSDWNTSKFGTHEPGMRFDDFRVNHVDDIRKTVDKEALRTIGSREYVVGTTDVPAPFRLNSARSGNYHYNIAIAKQMSLEGIKELNNIVGQIGNKLRIEKFENGGEVVWLPQHEITWGYLQKDKKALTPATIDKLDEKTTGIRFVPLKSDVRFVGRRVFKDECIKEVKRQMSLAGTKDEDGKTAWERFGGRKKSTTSEECGWNNLVNTQKRINPEVLYCFGFRNVQQGIPIFTGSDKDGNVFVQFVVGCRLVVGLTDEKKTVIAKVRESKIEESNKGDKKTKTKKKDKAPEIVSTEPVDSKEEVVAKEAVVSAEFSDDYENSDELVDVEHELRLADNEY